MIPTINAASTPSRSARRKAAVTAPPLRIVFSGSTLAFSAMPHDLVGVADRPEMVLAADLLLQHFDLRRGEFDDSAAAETDHVLVVPAHQGVLVEGGLVLQVEAGLPHQIAVDQMLERSVNRGARDADPLASQAGLQVLGVEMLLDRQHFGGDRPALRGRLQAAATQVGAEPEDRLGLRSCGGHRRLRAPGARPGMVPTGGGRGASCDSVSMGTECRPAPGRCQGGAGTGTTMLDYVALWARGTGW